MVAPWIRQAASSNWIRCFCTVAMSSTAFAFLAPKSSNSCKPEAASHFFDHPRENPLRNSFVFGNQATHTARCEKRPTQIPEVESYERMELPSRAYNGGHAIFGLLLGSDMIESYEVFKRPNDNEATEDDVLIALVKFGGRLNGHPNVVHGGILSLILDDALGFAYEALGIEMAVTANLKVDYRAPVPAGEHVRIAAQLEKRENRKIFWNAQITSLDKKFLYAEASSLYIIPRKSA